MIAKVEVRRQIALYEQKIREEIKGTRKIIQSMNNACGDSLMLQKAWLASDAYIELKTKLTVFNDVLSDIIDMRCSEIFND